MGKNKNDAAPRRAILAKLALAGRENSDATVLFHSSVANLLDLHPTDYKTLGILERLGPMAATEIARHSGLAPASVTNLIDRLERKGFVRRERDARDRRKVIVVAAEARVEAARTLFASTRRSLEDLIHQYPDRELAAIADFLMRNAARLRAETRKIEARRRRGPQ